jgi:hypothetical protein
VFTGTYEDWGNKLYTLWFGPYQRKGVLSTSGFEHVFIGQYGGHKEYQEIIERKVKSRPNMKALTTSGGHVTFVM